MELTTTREFGYLGRCLEGFFCGLYSGIFAMYLQYHAPKIRSNRTTNILYFALCVLYVLSIVFNVLDIARSLTGMTESTVYMTVSAGAIFGCCDFISQSILIYRCWIVWGNNIHVVIVPSILAFTFLGTWLAALPLRFFSGQIFSAFGWEDTLALTGLVISITVNALVMGLIVLRIFKVFWQVKATFESDEQNLGTSGGEKLRSIIFILIESGMALFSIQLARLVVTAILSTQAGSGYEFTTYYALLLITPIHQILNGITPTIILVRVSMGLSFHDEHSLVEATTSLCFAPDHQNPISETGNISTGYQESRDDDISEVT